MDLALSVGQGAFLPESTVDVFLGNGGVSGFTPNIFLGLNQVPISAGDFPSSFGQSVTFTATVTSKDSGNPTGTVSFSDGKTPLGTSLVSGGTATISTATFGVGSHSITARYSGDSHFTRSSSAPLIQVVDKAVTACNIRSSTGSFYKGEKIQFTASADTVAPGAGLPSGVVTFWDSAYSAIILGSRPLVSGSASLTVVLHPDPARQYVKAVYKGDGSHLGCESEYLPEFYEQ